ncbi:hypothetical protein QA601_05155 [Chitinispirillales bacterium ANBcel5]|uniref:hypothetical protein n=1 Tax=Cellulosispirillum alkaliphilum TaxID=3039283 RepID=UPI002A589CC3|nr:hypothetical protein [Chitinispirillales bacterium ANBcel5]
MLKYLLLFLSCTTIFAQGVPEPRTDGEGTSPSGVSIAGTPTAQLRLQSGMRTLSGDDRPFQFTLIDDMFGDSSTIIDSSMVKPKGSWGLGINVETSVQGPIHFGVAFDVQSGTFTMLGIAFGGGYNRTVINNRLWVQAKADILFGWSSVDIGSVPLIQDIYTEINDKQFKGDDLLVSLTSVHTVLRPELNTYLRVNRRGLIMLGAGYQFPLSVAEAEFELSGTSLDSGESITETLKATSSNVIFKMDGEKTSETKLAPSGLVVNISYVFEL